MNNKFTLQDLERLKSDGKIRDFQRPTKFKQEEPRGRIVTIHNNRKSTGLDFLASTLATWCAENHLTLFEEYRFDPNRRYRADWAIPKLKILFEYEGSLLNPNGDHRSVKGITRDMDKYNLAASLGWKIFRFGVTNYRSIVNELGKIKT